MNVLLTEIHTTDTVGWEEARLMNIIKIIFKGSQKIIAAIFSDGNIFVKITEKNTDGRSFVEFINELSKYIKSKKYYNDKRFLWLTVNAGFHKTKEVKSTSKEKFYGVWFIRP